MLDFWIDLPAWLRLGSALLMIAASILLFLFVSVRAGLVLVGVGCVLFIMGGKSSAEKNGYRF